MASSSSHASFKTFLLSFSLLLYTCSLHLSSAASATQFRVGGAAGWKPPTGNGSESYNHWAGRNRFRVGDYLYFKYENDSVLAVDREGYDRCNTTNPLFRFADGNTKFCLDRHGFFYFISGDAGHCRAGQKLIVRVMVHQDLASPAPAPLPEEGGSGSAYGFGPSGEPGSSGSAGAAAVARPLAAVAGLLCGLLLFLLA